MKAGTREADEHVARANPVRAQCGVFIDAPDDEAGESVVRRRVDAGHLGGLAAEQRALILAASSGDAGDDCFSDRWLEGSERNVVEEEQWYGTLDENVVRTVVDEIVADG